MTGVLACPFPTVLLAKIPGQRVPKTWPGPGARATHTCWPDRQAELLCCGWAGLCGAARHYPLGFQPGVFCGLQPEQGGRIQHALQLVLPEEVLIGLGDGDGHGVSGQRGGPGLGRWGRGRAAATATPQPLGPTVSEEELAHVRPLDVGRGQAGLRLLLSLFILLHDGVTEEELIGFRDGHRKAALVSGPPGGRGHRGRQVLEDPRLGRPGSHCHCVPSSWPPTAPSCRPGGCGPGCGWPRWA